MNKREKLNRPWDLQESCRFVYLLSLDYCSSHELSLLFSFFGNTQSPFVSFEYFSLISSYVYTTVCTNKIKYNDNDMIE